MNFVKAFFFGVFFFILQLTSGLHWVTYAFMFCFIRRIKNVVICSHIPTLKRQMPCNSFLSQICSKRVALLLLKMQIFLLIRLDVEQ